MLCSLTHLILLTVLPNVHKTSNTRDDTLDFLEEEDHKRQQADLEEDVNNDNIKKSYKVKMFQVNFPFVLAY